MLADETARQTKTPAKVFHLPSHERAVVRAFAPPGEDAMKYLR
jgi:hypothetical protein